MSLLLLPLLLGGAAAGAGIPGGGIHGADPWGRPGHLRIAAAPPERWADLSARKRAVRLWWDADPDAPPVEVQVLRGQRWRTLTTAARPGWESRPLPVGAALRVRRTGAVPGRWSPVLHAPTWHAPAELARLAAPAGGALLAARVGQVRRDPDTGAVWASTLGGGAVRVAPDGGVQTWSTWEGLPGDLVIDVDARGGAALLGTGRGALRIEAGVPVRAWDGAELGSTHVQAVALGVGEEEAWLGTDAGLSRVEGSEVEGLLSGEGVYTLVAEGGTAGGQEAGAWAGWRGLVRVDAEGVYGRLPQIAEDTDVYDLVGAELGEGGAARLWVATDQQGLLELDEHGAQAVLAGPATSVAVGPGGLWAALGADGLRAPDGTLHGAAAGLPADTVWAVEAGAPGLWVGTAAGLVRLLPGSDGDLLPVQQAWTVPRSRWPADARADALLVDRRGLLVGGDAGLTRVGSPRRDADDLVVGARQPVVALLDDGGGGAWAVGAAAVHLDRRGELRLVELPGVARDAVLDGGDLLLALPTGLFEVPAGTEQARLVLPADDLTRLAAGGGAVYAVQAGRVIRILDGRAAPVPAAGRALSLAADAGGIWVGGLAGLSRLVPGGGGALVPADLPALDELVAAVPAVAADGAGGAWLATDDGRVGHLPAEGPPSWLDLPLDAAVVGIDVDPRDPDVAWLRTVRGTWRLVAP